jgi:hypothetical protein
MKYLLRVLFVLALFFGVTSGARAQGFHMQVLDPGNICGSLDDVTGCIIIDSSAPLSIDLTAASCQIAGVPNLPSDPNTYGCAVLLNVTGEDITSLNLTFSGLEGEMLNCDTLPGSIFADHSCGTSGGGVDSFSFFDGVLPTLSWSSNGIAIIYEEGANPDLFADGTGDVNQPPILFTPEPEPLLLLSTGVMMMMAGLFVKRRRQLFAYGKK